MSQDDATGCGCVAFAVGLLALFLAIGALIGWGYAWLVLAALSMFFGVVVLVMTGPTGENHADQG